MSKRSCVRASFILSSLIRHHRSFPCFLRNFFFLLLCDLNDPTSNLDFSVSEWGQIEDGGVVFASDGEDVATDVGLEDELPISDDRRSGAAFVSGSTSMIVERFNGVEGMGVAGAEGAGVDVAYGARCTTCLRKHS